MQAIELPHPIDDTSLNILVGCQWVLSAWLLYLDFTLINIVVGAIKEPTVIVTDCELALLLERL
jgi:hypothetical protein